MELYRNYYQFPRDGNALGLTIIGSIYKELVPKKLPVLVKMLIEKKIICNECKIILILDNSLKGALKFYLNYFL